MGDTAPGQKFGEGARDSLSVMRGDTLLANTSDNKKRKLGGDREVAVSSKKLKVFE